ncbi:MAG: YicC/YloC family endoribonuclease [Thermodesulfobacteriota bacterium]
MLKSMTGFGRGEGETTLGRVFVETRSVNHRYCDINIKLPKRLTPFENRIKEMIRGQISRGRIDISVKLDSLGEENLQLCADLHLAEQYYKALQSLKKSLHLKDRITLALVAGAKDVITVKEESADLEPFWQELLPIVKRSFQDLDEMKRSEGESLSRDLHQRLEHIAQQLEKIKHLSLPRLEAYRHRLYERVRSLLGEIDVDPSRFQQEVALMAERMDITEEIVRAESHLARFLILLKADESVGRKMDFLVQEIHREVNTVSAKANDAEISQRVVEIKAELEKIREQVQNIE